jgi:hypothetical protein
METGSACGLLLSAAWRGARSSRVFAGTSFTHAAAFRFEHPIYLTR